MYIDSSLAFDPTYSPLTVSRDSTNVLDMLNPRDMGVGDKQLALLIQIEQGFTAAGAATLQVSFQGSPDNVNWYIFAQSGVYSLAQLGAGSRLLEIDLPRGGAMMPDSPGLVPRYYKLNYQVGNGPFTAGALFAGLVLDRSSATLFYPKNFSVNN